MALGLSVFALDFTSVYSELHLKKQKSRSHGGEHLGLWSIVCLTEDLASFSVLDQQSTSTLKYQLSKTTKTKTLKQTPSSPLYKTPTTVFFCQVPLLLSLRWPVAATTNPLTSSFPSWVRYASCPRPDYYVNNQKTAYSFQFDGVGSLVSEIKRWWEASRLVMFMSFFHVFSSMLFGPYVFSA